MHPPGAVLHTSPPLPLASLALLGEPLPAGADRANIIAFLASCQVRRDGLLSVSVWQRGAERGEEQWDRRQLACGWSCCSTPAVCPTACVTLLTCLPPRRGRQHPGGGFGGGPYQLAHLAPTYAAVAALVTLGGEAALDGEWGLAATGAAGDASKGAAGQAGSVCAAGAGSLVPDTFLTVAACPPCCPALPPAVVDRPRLHAFLLRMCVPPERGGGMTMHEGAVAGVTAGLGH